MHYSLLQPENPHACRWFSIKYGDKMFHEGGIINKRTSWNSNPQIFQRWRDGQTGLPLVDANMREIAQTGLLLCKIVCIQEAFSEYPEGIHTAEFTDECSNCICSMVARNAPQLAG